MNRKLIIIIGAITIAVLLFIGFNVFSPKKSDTIIPISDEIETIPTEPKKTTKTYTDSSGFTFDYPDDLTINQNTLDDNTIYSSLVITAADKKGQIKITLKDIKFKSIDAWFKATTDYTDYKYTTSVKCDDIEGKEYRSGSDIVLAALDDTVLIEMAVNSANDLTYWEPIYKTVTTTFKFAAPEVIRNKASTTAPAAKRDNEGSTIEEGEVIE